MFVWGFCIVGLVLAFAVQRLQRHSFLDTLAGPREDKGRLAKLRLCVSSSYLRKASPGVVQLVL